MKETASFLLFFLFLGLYSGAMSITTTVIYIFIGCGIIYLAWIEEKKEKLIKMKLIKMRKERLARIN